MAISHSPFTCRIIEMSADGSRDGKPFRATHLFLTSLHTTPEAMPHLVRDSWRIESWYWIRDTQPHEVAHRCRGYGAAVMATLRTAAMSLLRLAGFRSIRTCLQTVMDNIKALLAMAMRQPKAKHCSVFESALSGHAIAAGLAGKAQPANQPALHGRTRLRTEALVCYGIDRGSFASAL